MLWKIKNSGKSLLGLLLTLTLVAGMSVAYLKLQPNLSVLAAEPEENELGSTEPVYCETKDTLYPVKGGDKGTYNDGILTVPKETGAKILSDLPEEVSYCLSMTIQTTAQSGFNLESRVGGNTLNIQQTGCYLAGVTDWYQNTDLFGKLSQGLRVTIYSSMNRSIVWVDGQQVIDTPVTENGAAEPKLSWTYDGETMVTDMNIWTIGTAFPQYDSSTDVLYEVQGSLGGTYDTECKVLTVSSQEDAVIQTDMPTNSAYYCTMTIKNEGNVEIQCRADGTYIQLTPFFYRIFNGDDTPKTEQIRNSMLSKLSSKYEGGDEGVTLTFYSAMNTLKIWIGNEKIFEGAVLDSGAARPSILWSFEESQVSDIQVWTENDVVSDEPIYCETTDSLKSTTESFHVTASGTRDENLCTNSISSDQTFYVSYTVTSDGDCWLYNRGNHGRLLLQNGYWALYSASDTQLVGKSVATGLKDGVHITFCVEPNTVTMWMNGEKVADKISTGNTEEVVGLPRVYANTGSTTISDVKIWTKKAVISGSSATLEGTIKFNFFLNFDEEVTEEQKNKARICFLFPDGDLEELDLGEAGAATEYGYPFSCRVPAKEMADSIKVTVYYDGVKSQEYDYSVKQYAESVLTQTSNEMIQMLVKTMLNYGASAQKYFKYNSDYLANEGLAAEEQGILGEVVTGSFDDYQYQALQSSDVIAMQNISLLLKSETTLRLYFKCAPGVTIDNLEVTSSTCTPVIQQTENGSYCIAIENIAAGSLGDMHTITVKNKLTGQTDTCKVSALTYGHYAVNGSTKETLLNLVKSLYLYNQSARTILTK